MTHSATLGDTEVPITYSPQEAIGIIQEAGIVGAGGGGFPTYVKYQGTPQTLLVNGCESEPGYYSDKLLMRDEPEALVDVFEWLKDTFSIETIVLAAEEVAEPYMDDLKRIARRLKGFSIAFVPPKYKYGEEHALAKHALGIPIPKDDLPSEHGIVVNNNETLFHMYRAAFRERPMITKFITVYGEIGDPRVYEVPVGALACDILDIYGIDCADYAGCELYNGGPILSDKVAMPLGDEPKYPVHKNDNALLVVDPEKTPKNKHYPRPGWKANTKDAPGAPQRYYTITSIDRVRVPLDDGPWSHGDMLVEVGDDVAKGDDLCALAKEGLTIGVHASIDGRVTEITDEYVEIRKK